MKLKHLEKISLLVLATVCILHSSPTFFGHAFWCGELYAAGVFLVQTPDGNLGAVPGSDYNI